MWKILPGDPLPDARCGEEDELRRPAKDFLDPMQNAKPKVPESSQILGFPGIWFPPGEACLGEEGACLGTDPGDSLDPPLW